MPTEPIKVGPVFVGGPMQRLYRFPNGYGASLIDASGFSMGYYEVAVLKWDGDDFHLTYDTSLTNDVERFAAEKEALIFIEKVEAL